MQIYIILNLEKMSFIMEEGDEGVCIGDPNASQGKKTP